MLRRSISLVLRAALSTCLSTSLHAVSPVSTAGVTDVHGHPIAGLAPYGTRVVVLFFAASDCPISNRYTPEIARLASEFASRGVTVWRVFPNPGDTAQVVRAHDEQFHSGNNALIDTRQILVKMAHATITPEAAVFVLSASGFHKTYQGRIDDRYIAFGQERPQAMHHELEQAIRAALDGKAIPKPGGPPIGCSIVTRKP